VRRLLPSLMLITFAPAAQANEPATIVAVEGPVTLHGPSGGAKRSAARGARLDKASVVSVPKGAMVRLRFDDLRGTEFSLPHGTYTLSQARALARGGRTSTFDRVRSFLHVTMGDQISPIDAAAYLPVYTRTDLATMNVIWPEEWFGNEKAVLRYRRTDEILLSQVANVGPVVQVPTGPGLTMWVLESKGAKPALARGFVQRDLARPQDLVTAQQSGTKNEQIMAAYETGYYREAIRLLRDERKDDPQPDFVFEAALAPRLPTTLISAFRTALETVAAAVPACKSAPHLLVVDQDFVGVFDEGAAVFRNNLAPGAVVYALSASGGDKTVWNGVNTLSGGLASEGEGSATAILARLWVGRNGSEKADLGKIGARVERLPADDCLKGD
jgi:hypothetical protein